MFRVLKNKIGIKMNKFNKLYNLILQSLEQYQPPYNQQQMRQNGYSQETIQRLKRDPVHKWRMQTGIQLIHKQPTKSQLERIWKNWQLMTPQQKTKSNQKCMQLFGITNQVLYGYLIPQYTSQRPSKQNVMYPIYLQKSNSSNKSLDLIHNGLNLSAKASGDEQWKRKGLNRTIAIRKKYGHQYYFIKCGYDKIGIVQIGTYTNTACISNFAIFKNYQGQHLGKKALQYIIDFIKEKYPNYKIELGVAKINDKAKSLYQKLGFKVDSQWERGYSMILEQINQYVKENIKDNKVYLCRTRLYDKIEGKHTSSWSGEQGNVFVTPFKGIASCFVISRNQILRKFEQLGYRVQNCNFKYDVWNKPNEQLLEVAPVVNVTIQRSGLKCDQIVSGIATGYLYTIDFNKYKDHCHMFNKNPNSDVEFCIQGDVDYQKVQKITVNWTCNIQN